MYINIPSQSSEYVAKLSALSVDGSLHIVYFCMAKLLDGSCHIIDLVMDVPVSYTLVVDYWVIFSVVISIVGVIWVYNFFQYIFK